MSERRPPVEDFSDAMTWLGYMARFCEGDTGTNAAACMRLFVEMRDELEATKARCARISKHAEAVEAAAKHGGKS